MKRSKILRSADEKVDKTKQYKIVEAVKLMKECHQVKFDATTEVHFTLGIDPRHADQQLRSNVSLPHGIGKKVKVVVFCEDDQEKIARSAGAIEAGNEALIEKVSKGWTNFDSAVATPSMMKNLAKIARVLGPRGLMPNPKAGTVTLEVEKVVRELLAGRLEFRNDKTGIVHTVFGKISFTEQQLQENLKMMIDSVIEAKPSGQKGVYLKNITINSTMGIGIRVTNVEEESS